MEIWQIGLLLGTYAVTAAIFELPLDAIADLYGRIKIYRLSRVVYISGVALALLSDEFYGLIGAMVVMGISQAINTGTVDAWQVEQINKKGYQESLQSYLSLFEMAMAAFIALGALVGGYLPERIDHSLLGVQTNWNLDAVLIVVGIHLMVSPFLSKEVSNSLFRSIWYATVRYL